MHRAKDGQIISAARRTPEAVVQVEALLADAQRRGDLNVWRRCRAVLGYIAGRPVLSLLQELGAARSSVTLWLQWYEHAGVEGLLTKKAPGAAPRLSDEQRQDLSAIIASGPQKAGFTSGVWTGPMIARLIEERYGVVYHRHHIPRLLHGLGFTVQRPRKRLARADAEAQAQWLKERFPAIKKKPHHAGA